MRKKKTNPNRIPVSWSEADTHQATEETTRDCVLLAWELVLCALADRWDTTAQSLLTFWDKVNTYSTKLNTFEEIETRLDTLAGIIGTRFALHRISTANIHTKGDVERLRRKLRENALHSMFALIADTILQKELMEQDALCRLFEKVRSMAEDLERSVISEPDLLGVLRDEFSLHLFHRDGNGVLELSE